MITLNFENLEYICQKCHTQEHLRDKPTREDVMFDQYGNLIKKKPPQLKIKNNLTKDRGRHLRKTHMKNLYEGGAQKEGEKY